MMTAPWPRHPNSQNFTSCGTVGPQYHSALFLNVSHELLFHSSRCAFPFVGRAASLSSTLLSFLSCAFPLSRHTSSLLSPWCAFPSAGHATLLIFFHDGHYLHLCLSSPHLKHFTATVLIFLIVLSSTPHCITLLLKILNLFWDVIAPFPVSFYFLQFRARCPNPLQPKHNFPLFPSSSFLSLARECFSLSKLLMIELYCCRDIYVTSPQ